MKSDDNPKAFKHMIGVKLLRKLAHALNEVEPSFPESRLVKLAPRLDPLELKDRVRLVRSELRDILPEPYPRAIQILLKASDHPALEGFDLWPVTDFVQTYGLGHFEESMKALYVLTQKFTAEFALRPFLHQHPELTFQILEQWTEDPNEHVRRAVSEGTRPRLPWGEQVPALIKNPEPGLALLARLKFDKAMYVRRSVANHMNDVSRDHPETAIRTLKQWWMDAPVTEDKNITWITHRALRGLIKKGHPAALKLIGVGSDPAICARSLRILNRSPNVGDYLEFSFEVESTAKKAQKLIIDYLVHHVKASGETRPKVFKLKTLELAPGQKLELMKRHSLKPVTVRTYYPGKHRLEIQVNGKVVLHSDWNLLPRTR